MAQERRRIKLATFEERLDIVLDHSLIRPMCPDPHTATKKVADC